MVIQIVSTSCLWFKCSLLLQNINTLLRRCLKIKLTLRECILLLLEATTKHGMRSGSFYLKFLLLYCLAFFMYPEKMLPFVLNCIVLCVTKHKGFQKSPALFFSCVISMVMLGATGAVPGHISIQKKVVGFPGTIYSS